jgi:hypothetical protein
MSVFISYSHSDKEFVDKLVSALIQKHVHVWVDRLELRAGDSLIDRIQQAITSAGAMLVILSKASVASEWCRKELSVGLIRELEEKRVVVVPVLKEDCDVPLFLRDKLHADFRTSFDDGFQSVLDAVARATAEGLGRIQEAEYYFDWAMDWAKLDAILMIRFTIVEHHKYAPYSVLTVIEVRYNEAATERYSSYEKIGLDWFGRRLLVEALGIIGTSEELVLVLDDQFENKGSFKFKDVKSDISFSVDVSSRRLGEDTNKDILVDIGGQLRTLREAVMSVGRKLTTEETIRLAELIANRA